MEEQILEILKNSNKALSIYEINDRLGLKSSDELRELQSTLYSLVDEFKICQSKKNKYLLFENSHYKKGRFSVHRSGRFGFVSIAGEPDDIRIDEADFKDATHNDIVIVEVDKKNNTIGRIVKVVQRDDSDLVGEYYTKNGIGYVKLDNPRYKDFVIAPTDNKGAVDGHKVLVKRIKELESGQFQGEVLKILGHKDDVGVDILSIVYEYGIPEVFDEAVMTELESIPDAITESDLVGRRDLRDQVIFTIDGDDAKDFDQATGIKKLDNGNYYLGVHIADVSHYVKEDSALGKEAYNRGNSVYLVDRVIPMLPHRLSNGITSLNEGVNRLAVTCDIEIDPKGNIVKYDIYTSVVNSKKRMTYNSVNKILERNEVVPGYEPFVNDLRLTAELASILRKNRTDRGYLDFDTDEMQIVVDKSGEPVEITKRYRGVGEKMIEDVMIAANEVIGTHFHYLDMPLVYRIHEEPDVKKMDQFILLLNSLGYRIKAKTKHFDGRSMQNILAILQEKEEWPILSNLTLRTMKKARYSPYNVGHFGLGLKYYAHFTAPNRRLPDLIVQRIIKGSLNIPGYRNNYSYEELSLYSDHASLTEDRSVKCERAVEKYEASKYMEKHIGEEYNAIIASISKEGLWVQLDNLIEGLIRISEIGNDYFDFDERIQVMKGRRSGKMYRIGQKVRVVVTGADKVACEIDFAFIDNKNSKK